MFINSTIDHLLKSILISESFFITNYVQPLLKAYQYPHYLHNFNKTTHKFYTFIFNNLNQNCYINSPILHSGYHSMVDDFYIYPRLKIVTKHV